MRFLGSGIAALGVTALLSGCDHLLLLNPKGPIGAEERFVLIAAVVLMLIVVIPVAIMNIWFPWRYRASRSGAAYSPKWATSLKLEVVVWLVPALIVTALSILVWDTTHRLDPYKPIDTGVKPVRIEAVSLDWKWLFIYPDFNIAAVNKLVFPAKVPLSFRLTSASVMTSFFIPQLGSQIYAMGGMQTQLNLLADEPGTYAGQNQQYSGEGYAGMNFKAIATSREAFEDWIAQARQSPETLDLARYEQLEAPSENAPVMLFSGVQPGLFDTVLVKYGMSMQTQPAVMNSRSHDMESHGMQMKPNTSEKN